MSGSKKNNPAEDLMQSLMNEVGASDDAELPDGSESTPSDDDSLDLGSAGAILDLKSEDSEFASSILGAGTKFDEKTDDGYDGTAVSESTQKIDSSNSFLQLSDEIIGTPEQPADPKPVAAAAPAEKPAESLFSTDSTQALSSDNGVETRAIGGPVSSGPAGYNSSEKTVAVTGYQQKQEDDFQDKVKVSIGQNRSAYSPGYAGWGSGSDAMLGQAENLRMAQEKILELEKENEKLRIQNEELISASDIIKERSDLLTAQVTEYKNDKENLEESFKNEIALLKGHLHRKENEMQKAQLKIDDLDSRLKFDMKKIRIRERELENRLELIRAEKNALTKSKDEQILDLRRKMDVLQLEVESYRQKCVDLNKTLETNQDSFKRTTRALRLAMANLELQEENKPSLKKVD